MKDSSWVDAEENFGGGEGEGKETILPALNSFFHLLLLIITNVMGWVGCFVKSMVFYAT